jgi:hypothetical protein
VLHEILETAATRFTAPENSLALQPRVTADPDYHVIYIAMRPATPRELTRRLRQLVLGVERFNRTWSTRVAAIDLTPLNLAIERYNTYYSIEREVFVKYTPGTWRFFPKAKRTTADFEARYPLLPALTLARSDRRGHRAALPTRGPILSLPPTR